MRVAKPADRFASPVLCGIVVLIDGVASAEDCYQPSCFPNEVALIDYSAGVRFPSPLSALDSVDVCHCKLEGLKCRAT